MNRALLATLLLASTSGCARREVPLAFSPVTEGLRAQHRGATPLLEVVACLPPIQRPGAASCFTSRLYPDGGYYLLPADGANVRWNMLSTLKPEGIAELEKLFAGACDPADPLRANDAGSTRYLVNLPGCRREILVTGVPEGRLADLQRVNEIIGRHLEKIPPGR